MLNKTMWRKTITTVTLCFYYLYFLAVCEAFIWLDQSSILILSFTGVHVLLKTYQWIEHGSSLDGLHPYRNLSTALKTAVILSDTLVTFIVVFGFLFIENREADTDNMFKYLLCFFCFPITIVNIIKHHIRQVEAATISDKFSSNFDP